MREPEVSLGLNMEVDAEGYHSTHGGCQPKCFSSSHYVSTVMCPLMHGVRARMLILL